MDLKYPFLPDVRRLFVGVYECYECGGNGTNCAGLELHHIYGRISSSVFNAAVLCHNCHDKVQHSREERVAYFMKTFHFVHQMAKEGLYSMTSEDDRFIRIVFPEVSHKLSPILT